MTALQAAIRKRLEDDNVSLRTAAEIIGGGVSHQTVKNWADGFSSPNLRKHQRGIARFLQISPRRVLELDGLSLSDEDLGAYLKRFLTDAA